MQRLYLIGYEWEIENVIAPTKPARKTYSRAPRLTPYDMCGGRPRQHTLMRLQIRHHVENGHTRLIPLAIPDCPCCALLTPK